MYLMKIVVFSAATGYLSLSYIYM